jgi:hypothetical protein
MFKWNKGTLVYFFRIIASLFVLFMLAIFINALVEDKIVETNLPSDEKSYSSQIVNITTYTTEKETPNNCNYFEYFDYVGALIFGAYLSIRKINKLGPI